MKSVWNTKKSIVNQFAPIYDFKVHILPEHALVIVSNYISENGALIIVFELLSAPTYECCSETVQSHVNTLNQLMS